MAEPLASSSARGPLQARMIRRHLAAQRRTWFSACSGSGQRSSDGVKTGNRG
jgi:hypothetical protein